jgi:hypothetical protein
MYHHLPPRLSRALRNEQSRSSSRRRLKLGPERTNVQRCRPKSSQLAHDLQYADRGEPTQRAQEHRTDQCQHEAPLAPQSLRPGVQGRNRSRAARKSRRVSNLEAAILSEYLTPTLVENALVCCLASLFWRLRRATSIETGLLRMQGEILRAFRNSRQKTVERRGYCLSLKPTATPRGARN